jgi:hypothetical protein
MLHDGDNLPEKSWDTVTPEWMLKNFQVNTIAPALIMKHFGTKMGHKKSRDEHFALLATLSARVGSIEDNRIGGWYSYRTAKAA